VLRLASAGRSQLSAGRSQLVRAFDRCRLLSSLCGPRVELSQTNMGAAMLEIARRVNAAAQDFKAENARLRAALDHANGDRARLAYELAGP
jgi:hypothetical protein